MWGGTPEEMEKKMVSQGTGFVPRSFSLKPNTKAAVVFVDEAGFAIQQHTRFRRFPKMEFFSVTCNSPEISCCEKCGSMGRDRTLAIYFTVIDTRRVSWQGKTFENSLLLLPVKFFAWEKLKSRRAKYGFEGKLYEFERFGQTQESAIGSVYDYVRDVDMPSLFEQTMFGSQYLPAMFDAAEKDPNKMEQLRRVFQVELDANGKLVRTIPAFNYQVILSPPTEEQLVAKWTQWNASEKAEPDAPEGDRTENGDGETAPEVAASFSTDVPF